jgi:hypothetical protein
LGVYETSSNQQGIACLSLLTDTPVLALPGRASGQIQLISLFDPKTQQSTAPQVSILVAHNAPIACLAMSNSGKYLATASEKGTLIRVWHTQSLSLLHEFRRGSEPAQIYSISFSKDESRIVVSSDKGTIHIFNMNNNSNSSVATESEEKINKSSSLNISLTSMTGNRQSVLSPLSNFLPKYFSSEWSFASFSLPVESQCLVRFTRSDRAVRYQHDPLLSPLFQGEENGILVLCADGSLYKYRFDPKKGGECVLESFYVFYRKPSKTAFCSIVDSGVEEDFWEDWEEE